MIAYWQIPIKNYVTINLKSYYDAKSIPVKFSSKAKFVICEVLFTVLAN